METVEIPLLREKSERIYKRSCTVIPSGVNSPVRAFPGLNQTPLVAEKGFQDRVYDADGFAYIDFCGSWGALIHGHAHPCIVEAAKKRVEMGSSFGMTTAIEAQLAEMVVEAVPSIEKVRFVSTGTESAMSAIRLARGYTGRTLIVKFEGHYHGHADSLLVQAGSGALYSTCSSAGVPEECVKHTINLPFNNQEAIRELFQTRGKNIAAVILEPIAANMGVVAPDAGFIQMLREETSKWGALLIFDEVITGFRISFGGASEYFQIEPDLICFGKVVGGGFPAAAFGGRSTIMDLLAPAGPVYQAGTLSGNPVAMEAGLQALLMCQESGFYEALENKTKVITEPVQELIEKKKLNMCLQREGSLFTLFFGQKKIRNLDDVKQCDLKQFAHFFQTLFKKGIYLAPSQFEANFVSAAHSMESLQYTRDCILDALLA